jgi:two-component system, OmpR family, sensor histidine kinase MprB
VTFRKRLTLFSAAGIAIVLVVGSATTYLIVRGQLRGQVDESLQAQSQTVSIVGVAGALPPDLGAGLPAGGGLRTVRISVGPPEFGAQPVFVGLIDGSGNMVAPPVDDVDLPVSARALDVARSGTGAYFADIQLRGTHMRMYVKPVAGGRALLLGRSLAAVDDALSRLAWSLGVTCLIGIVLAGIVGALVARGALRPVRSLTAHAERIAATHDLGDRIEPHGDDELGRLSATFNEMLDSLERAIRAQRQLVTDASHELRTPLTSLRTNIDLLRQGTVLDEGDRGRLLRDVSNELDELSALVANTVDLARGSQRELHLQPVRLDEIVAAVAERARARFPGVEVVIDQDEATVWGDREELERAIWNLVENAAKWSGDGDRIELAISGSDVVVRDHGPGVPAADKPFVFDRFYRSEVARGRPGSGLGLAIVRQIAESHGGRVEVDDAPGGGARFRLSLLAA